jgi:hypothetical protein
MGHENMWQMLAFMVTGQRIDKAGDAQKALGEMVTSRMQPLEAGDTIVVDFSCRVRASQGYYDSIDAWCQVLVGDLLEMCVTRGVNVVLVAEAYHLTPPQKAEERLARKESRQKQDEKKVDKPSAHYDDKCTLRLDGIYRGDERERIYVEYVLEIPRLYQSLLRHVAMHITMKLNSLPDLPSSFIVDVCDPGSPRTPTTATGDPIKDELPDAICLSGEGEYAAVGWVKHLGQKTGHMNTTMVVESTDSDALLLLLGHLKYISSTCQVLWRFRGGGCLNIRQLASVLWRGLTFDQFLWIYFTTGCDYIKKNEITYGVGECDVIVIVQKLTVPLSFDPFLRVVAMKQKQRKLVKLCKTDTCEADCGCVRATFEFFKLYCEQLFVEPKSQ